jgi:hypothetical protein
MIGSRPYPSRDGSALRGIAFLACRLRPKSQARHQRNHSFATLLYLSNLPQLALIRRGPRGRAGPCPIPCLGRIFIVIPRLRKVGDATWTLFASVPCSRMFPDSAIISSIFAIGRQLEKPGTTGNREQKRPLPSGHGSSAGTKRGLSSIPAKAFVFVPSAKRLFTGPANP